MTTSGDVCVILLVGLVVNRVAEVFKMQMLFLQVGLSLTHCAMTWQLVYVGGDASRRVTAVVICQ